MMVTPNSPRSPWPDSPAASTQDTMPPLSTPSAAPAEATDEESSAYSTLSERELQIVELVADGLTNQEISQQLAISKRTVDNHVSNILTKTKTGNRVALVRWALQWGKVCIDDVNCCVLPPPSTPGSRPPGNAPRSPSSSPGNQDSG